MNRRAFIRLVGIAVVAPALPSIREQEDSLQVFQVPKQFQWPSKFDPSKECSHGVRYTVGHDPEMPKKAKAMLVKNMEAYVPPPYRKHVKYASRTFNWGQTEAIAWYYEPPGRDEEAA